jgi:hypothetical protein
MLALPPGRIVATLVGAGGAPTGAPGGVVVVVEVEVVVVVVVLWPAAGAAAISATQKSRPANVSRQPWRDLRDSKEIPPPVPSPIGRNRPPP